MLKKPMLRVYVLNAIEITYEIEGAQLCASER